MESYALHQQLRIYRLEKSYIMLERTADTTLLATVTLLYIGDRQRCQNDSPRIHMVRHPSKVYTYERSSISIILGHA